MAPITPVRDRLAPPDHPFTEIDALTSADRDDAAIRVRVAANAAHRLAADPLAEGLRRIEAAGIAGAAVIIIGPFRRLCRVWASQAIEQQRQTQLMRYIERQQHQARGRFVWCGLFGLLGYWQADPCGRRSLGSRLCGGDGLSGHLGVRKSRKHSSAEKPRRYLSKGYEHSLILPRPTFRTPDCICSTF
jgi:hypothetical protein